MGSRWLCYPLCPQRTPTVKEVSCVVLTFGSELRDRIQDTEPVLRHMTQIFLAWVWHRFGR